MLEKDLTRDHDINKLKEMLKDFDKEMRKQREREQALAQERKKILNEIEDLRQKELKLNSTKGKYAAEKEAHEKRQRERFLLMEKIAQTYSIELQQSLTQLSRLDASMMSMSQTSLLTGGGTQETTPPELTKEDLDGFFAAVEKKEAELKENLRSHKATYRAQEEEFNSALQDLVGKRNAFENGTFLCACSDVGVCQFFSPNCMLLLICKYFLPFFRANEAERGKQKHRP